MIKFTKHKQKVDLGALWGGFTEIDGHLFFLPEYPTIQLFVAQNPKNKLYSIYEPRTGLKCGGGFEKTRVAIAEKQLEVFENMRNSKNGQGQHSYVVDMVEKCVNLIK
jgi:hypothetical protein